MPLPIGWRPSVVTTSTAMPKWSPTNSKSLRSRIASMALRELGGRTDRKVDQQMGRARGELLRHDRSDHLLARVEAKRPLDGNEDVVGRRQIDVATPDQTAVTCRDDLLHLVDAEIDPRQHLHRVGGARRRGDGARGRLGDRQPVRRDDRHNDHGRAIARDAADAMLVDDDRPVPFELRSGLGHRMGQSEKLVARHETGGADQERRDLHVGIAIVREVIDDRADFRRAQRAALDFGAHRVETSGEAAGVTVTKLPAGSAKRRNAGSARPRSSGPTRASSSVMRSVASSTLELRRSSTRLKPRKTPAAARWTGARSRRRSRARYPD